MKKLIRLLLFFIAIILVLNLNVSIKQGINYEVRTLKIPLYLKILDFYDRHFNYGYLADSIVKGIKNPEEKAVRIFEWTYANIHRTPIGMPVVDDHVWHIIVRGYGNDDQFADVFSTLCNYAGLDALFLEVFRKDEKEAIVLSFVKIGNKWLVFDPYNGVYFVDAAG